MTRKIYALSLHDALPIYIHYVVKAIRDARAGSTTAKFLGRDPRTHVRTEEHTSELQPHPASVCSLPPVNNKYGNKAVPNGNFLPSHSDIVIAVDANRKKL